MCFKIFIQFRSLFVALTLLSVATMVFAEGSNQTSSEPANIDSRLERLERLLDSQALTEMLFRLDDLNQLVSELRGSMDEHSHALTTLKQRQRDLYVDLDKRMRHLELNIASLGSAPSSSVNTASAALLAGSTAPAVIARSSPVVMPVADPAQERAAYQRAFDFLKEGRYDNAINEFKTFLAAYPAGEYADNAQYWLGEANYVLRRFNVAVEEFDKVITGFPNSPKIPDAKLKKGFSYYELSQWDLAKQTLSQVVSNHPNTTPARLAGNRLQKMKSENN